MTSDTNNVSSADLARQVLATAAKIRRMTSGDPKYHSGRPKNSTRRPTWSSWPRLRPTPAACHSPTSSTPGTPTGSGTRIWMRGSGS
jgi:hypothetical protein